jgi:DNA-binding beta-propeller fold protein YncE
MMKQMTIVPLPDGFRPVGIACGKGQTVYVGSSDSGAIYAIDLATAKGRTLVTGQYAQGVLGLAYDVRTNCLLATGGAAGNALVYDADSGALVCDIQLTTDVAGLVQDVTVTDAAAYFTDAGRPVVYRVRLTELEVARTPVGVEEMWLSGDFNYVQDDLNASGIVASPDRQALVVVHTALGTLYRVDPITGSTTRIDIGDTVLKDSSGLVLDKAMLYVVNFNNRIHPIALSPTFHAGSVGASITSSHFDNPSSAVIADNVLVVVSARLTTEPLPETKYWLTSIRLS